MQVGAVGKYLTSSVKAPYFLFVSDGQYTSTVDELSLLGLTFVKVSDYCSQEDRLPDVDRLLEHIQTAEVNAKDNKLTILGLGEYLALRGSAEAVSVLSRLKDLNIGGAKVVLILRGLASQIARLQADPRFDSRRFSVIAGAECNLSFTLAAPAVGLSALTGFRAMLAKLESGACGTVVVNSAVTLDNALFTVHKINSAYEGIRVTTPSFGLPRSCGSDALWSELLLELNQNNSSLDEVFENYGLNGNLQMDSFVRTVGGDFRSWLYFVAIKQRAMKLENSYLRFVVENTDRFEDFKAMILNAIIDVPHTDKRFAKFYAERKALVEKFPEPDVAYFVINNRKNSAESIYKLTDGTKTEREEIIAWVSKNGLVPQIADIYPALAMYLKKYIFNCGELSSLLTDYFDAYKRQKVANKLEDEFLALVDNLAVDRKYNRLPARSEVIDSLDKNDTFLFWLDALGVEYLSFISELARNRGLSIAISIARAELPTITRVNRAFFDDWTGSKEKKDTLDEVKHKDAGGYNFIGNQLPIHLAKELDIVAEVVDRAATALALRNYKRFVIVSDHGASRLAVLRRKEERYQTDTQGEFSGRCCEQFEPHDLPFAAEENNYLVLADYGMFKGSRAANVEVHGGASLEEVVVPIIVLTLKKGNVTIELIENSVTVDLRTGISVTLFANAPLKDVALVANAKRYLAAPRDAHHYKVALPDIKRAGEYQADVYAGDDLIGKVVIKVRGRSGKVDDDFDVLFKG